MKLFSLIGVLAALVLAAAGCGGGGSSESSNASAGAYGGESNESSSGGAYGGSGESAASTPSAQGAAMVSVAQVPKLGKIIVDKEGFTLYDFHKDKGTTSSCYGACAKAWPPLTTEGAPRAANGAQMSMISTTKRNDGTMQVTYAGHPVYTFSEDTKPGEANGNDVSAFGGQWYALKGNGEEAGG
jgi:predicted lipoprotein with Yx(FWY)xxD motif